MAIREFGGADRLRIVDLPRPRPGRGEILIRVVAAGVDPLDLHLVEGRIEDVAPRRFPLIPGWNAAGVVEELGEDAGRFRKGDRVWALVRKPVAQWGCWAEYVAVAESAAGLMPSKLLFEEAGTVPVATLTIPRCLHGRAAPAPGASVLIHGGAAGIAPLGVQLLRGAGFRVVQAAPGSEAPAFFAPLGAAATIDSAQPGYLDECRRHAPAGFDLVLDAGAGAAPSPAELVKPGGRLVTLSTPPDGAPEQIEVARVLPEPDPEQLDRVARQVDRGDLRVQTGRILPLDRAAEALELVRKDHPPGQPVLAL